MTDWQCCCGVRSAPCQQSTHLLQPTNGHREPARPTDRDRGWRLGSTLNRDAVSEDQLNHCCRVCTGCLCVNALTINSPISVIWRSLFTNWSTMLIWSAHMVSRIRYDHQHKVFFPFPLTTSTLLLVSLSWHQDCGTLPMSCRTAPSVNIFKNWLKTFLFSLW